MGKDHSTPSQIVDGWLNSSQMERASEQHFLPSFLPSFLIYLFRVETVEAVERTSKRKKKKKKKMFTVGPGTCRRRREKEKEEG